MLETMYSIIFVCIVQISSLATTCTGQHLLTFWSHPPEQSCMFALIIVALNITYCFGALLPMLTLKGIVSYV